MQPDQQLARSTSYKLGLTASLAVKPIDLWQVFASQKINPQGMKRNVVLCR